MRSAIILFTASSLAFWAKMVVPLVFCWHGAQALKISTISSLSSCSLAGVAY